MLKVKYDAHRPVFSAVSSAFTIDIQSKLQPDPNEMTAAYMRILIHAVDSSLFPDADLDPVTWTGPLPRGRHGQVSALYESRDHQGILRSLSKCQKYTSRSQVATSRK